MAQKSSLSFLGNTRAAGLANFLYKFLYCVSSCNDTLGNISGEMAPKKTVVDRKMLRAATCSILYRGKLQKAQMQMAHSKGVTM